MANYPKKFPDKPKAIDKWHINDPIRHYVEALEGALDITLRVLNGEPDDSLAADYGGMGYEYHPTVIQAYRSRAEIEAGWSHSEDHFKDELDMHSHLHGHKRKG